MANPDKSSSSLSGKPATAGKVVPMNDAQRRLATAKASISVGDSMPLGRRELSAHQEISGFGQLTIEQIKPFDKNPRITRNPAYFELKDSIRANGFKSTLSVTRRPGDDIYMVSSGGNTRLAILNELYAETGDRRYFEIPVTHEPYICESKLISDHLIENEVRGETTFWEKASGLMMLRDELEKEIGRPLSQRGLETHLSKELGFSISASAINYYQFAWQKLNKLGPFLTTLSKNSIKDCLQPRYSQIHDLARLFGIDDARFSAQVIEAGVVSYAETFMEGMEFNPEELCAEWELKFGQTLGKSDGFVRRALGLRATFEQLSGKEIEQRIAEEDERSRRQREAQAAGTLPQEASKQSTVSPPASHANPESRDVPAVTAPLPPPGPDRQGQLLRYILGQVIQFAKIAELSDLIAPASAMACGFYIELPAEHKDTKRRLAGVCNLPWWMLAALSGQLDHGNVLKLPKTALWRRVQLLEGISALDADRMVDLAVGKPPEIDYVMSALSDPVNDLAAIYLSILDGVRQLREIAPDRFQFAEAA